MNDSCRPIALHAPYGEPSRTLSDDLRVSLWAAGALIALYLTGAAAIHVKGPGAFILWEMGLPAPLPTVLWQLYGGWIFWIY